MSGISQFCFRDGRLGDRVRDEGLSVDGLWTEFQCAVIYRAGTSGGGVDFRVREAQTYH